MGLPWVYGLFLSLMGGKMGLQKAILEGELAPYPWQIFGKNLAEMKWNEKQSQDRLASSDEFCKKKYQVSCYIEPWLILWKREWVEALFFSLEIRRDKFE